MFNHKMYCNNILNFRECPTILNACTKKYGNLLKALRVYIYIYIKLTKINIRLVNIYIYIYIYIYISEATTGVGTFGLSPESYSLQSRFRNNKKISQKSFVFDFDWTSPHDSNHNGYWDRNTWNHSRNKGLFKKKVILTSYYVMIL